MRCTRLAGGQLYDTRRAQRQVLFVDFLLAYLFVGEFCDRVPASRYSLGDERRRHAGDDCFMSTIDDVATVCFDTFTNRIKDPNFVLQPSRFTRSTTRGARWRQYLHIMQLSHPETYSTSSAAGCCKQRSLQHCRVEARLPAMLYYMVYRTGTC